MTEQRYERETGKAAPAPRTMSAMQSDAAKNYKSSHWDQPNILAHIRLNDRTDAEGKKVLFVEEIQSDWGQDGKKKGFGERAPKWEVFNAKTGEVVSRHEREDAASNAAIYPLEDGMHLDWRLAEARGAVPTAPFVTATDKWLSLAMKRVIKMAVDGGYDKVAFVNGEQSASRYDLSKHVDSIEWTTYDGKGYISLHGLKGVSDQTLEIGVDKKTGIVGPMDIGAPSEWQDKHLSDVVGKDVADKVLGEDKGKLSGDGLKVGGSGMKAFYDKIVPSAVGKLISKFGGGKMETVGLATDKTNSRVAENRIRKQTGEPLVDEALLDQPGFTITPAMQEKAAGGCRCSAGPPTS